MRELRWQRYLYTCGNFRKRRCFFVLWKCFFSCKKYIIIFVRERSNQIFIGIDFKIYGGPEHKRRDYRNGCIHSLRGPYCPDYTCKWLTLTYSCRVYKNYECSILEISILHPRKIDSSKIPCVSVLHHSGSRCVGHLLDLRLHGRNTRVCGVGVTRGRYRLCV